METLKEKIQNIILQHYPFDGGKPAEKILVLFRQELEGIVGDVAEYGKHCGDECGMSDIECIKIIDANAEGWNSKRHEVLEKIHNLLK